MSSSASKKTQQIFVEPEILLTSQICHCTQLEGPFLIELTSELVTDNQQVNTKMK